MQHKSIKSMTMKKLITVFFLTVYISTIAFAEEPAGKKFHFGLKGAPGLFWIKPENSKEIANNGSKFGFSYGLILEFGITDNYSFATGIDVAGMAAKYTRTVDSTSTITNQFKYDTKLNYVQIPLTLKMKTKNINGIKYFGQFGLNAGFNYKAVSDYTKTTTGLPAGAQSKDYNEEDIKDITLPLRLALVVGGGVEYNLSGATSILFAAHYDNGFLSINKKDEGKLFSKGVVATVGILF